jgi:hypothetical protein
VKCQLTIGAACGGPTQPLWPAPGDCGRGAGRGSSGRFSGRPLEGSRPMKRQASLETPCFKVWIDWDLPPEKRNESISAIIRYCLRPSPARCGAAACRRPGGPWGLWGHTDATRQFLGERPSSRGATANISRMAGSESGTWRACLNRPRQRGGFCIASPASMAVARFARSNFCESGLKGAGKTEESSVVGQSEIISRST